MKTLLFIFLFLQFSLASTIYTNGKCVEYFDVYDKSNTLYIEYSSGRTTTTKATKSKLDILAQNVNKYKYEDNYCIPILEDNTKLFMSSIIGVLIGFTILFFSLFITIKVGSKR